MTGATVLHSDYGLQQLNPRYPEREGVILAESKDHWWILWNGTRHRQKYNKGFLKVIRWPDTPLEAVDIMKHIRVPAIHNTLELIYRHHFDMETAARILGINVVDAALVVSQESKNIEEARKLNLRWEFEGGTKIVSSVGFDWRDIALLETKINNIGNHKAP